MTDCQNSKCCKSNCPNKKRSSLPFFATLLVVVAVGGGLYTYLDATVFAPTEAQEQTAMQNPGMPHPPKSKMHARRTESASTSTPTAPVKPSTNAADSNQ